MYKIKLNKQYIVTGFFIIFCLMGYIFFPASNFFQYRSVAVIFLVILPFLFGRYFLRKTIYFNKIKIGDWKNNLKLLSVGLFFSFAIIFIIFNVTDLQQHYLLSPVVKTDFWKFLIYEFTGIAFTVAIYELFFRGFVMFYAAPFFGKWAILIQFLFFIGMSLIFGLPYWFYITYLIFNPFAGWIAYKSDSMMYSFVGQLLFIIIVDSSFIALTVK